MNTDETYRRYRPADGPFHQSTFAGHDPGLCALGVRAAALFVLGHPDRAYAELDALQPLIRASTHPPSRLVGWYCTCLTYITAREPLRMRALAEEALAICRRMSIQQYDGMFTVYTAWAITVARAQGARSYMLRAANGLARLWQQGARGAEVRPRIAPLLAQFTPGFSTPDLDEARILVKGAGQ